MNIGNSDLWLTLKRYDLIIGRKLLCLTTSDELSSLLGAILEACRLHYAKKSSTIKSIFLMLVVLKAHHWQENFSVVVFVFLLVYQFGRSSSLHHFLMEGLLILCIVSLDASLITHSFL